MDYDILHINGKPHVLVPIHDFTALKNGAGQEELPEEILEQLALKQSSPIKILRKHRGFTQGALAQEAGISRPYLTEIETGRKDGSIRALKAIAEALGVSLDALAT